jgi:hypothetical protein
MQHQGASLHRLRTMACCSAVLAGDVGIMGRVEILYWWLPPAIVTVIAMLWVSWLGRARDMGPDRSDAAQERFAAAIMRDLPTAVTSRESEPRPIRERSTGIAIRPSQRPGIAGPGPGGSTGPEDSSRRSA